MFVHLNDDKNGAIEFTFLAAESLFPKEVLAMLNEINVFLCIQTLAFQ
jgi:hypothetical protein